MNKEELIKKSKELEETMKEIYSERQRLDDLKKETIEKLIEYRISSAMRVLDYLHTKSFFDKPIPIKTLGVLITHTMNKLNGNIDGIELDLEEVSK
jgi:hypothetical protein